jgi:hypothetical protein
MSLFKRKKNTESSKEKVSQNSTLMDKDALDAGEKIVRDLKEDVVSLPSNIQIDFAAVRKEKDLITYLSTFAEQHFSAPKTAQFIAIKYEDGFLYEMHENGDGYGYLSSVLKILESGEDAILVLDDNRRVRVSKEGTRIKTITMGEDDQTDPSSSLVKKDKLSLIFKPSLFFFLFGLTLTIIGIISLFVALSFKYIVVDQSQIIQYPLSTIDSPLTASKSKEMRVNRTERITKMEYTENKGWKYSKEDKK